MRARWNAIGGQLGIGFCVVGFVVVFLGWNGAASYDREPAQLPYLVSGGIGGLGLILVGVGLLVVANQRTDRAALQQGIAEVREAVELLARLNSAEGAGDVVLAGGTSFHRVGCRLTEGRGPLARMSVEEAQRAGLAACRVCETVGTEAPAAAPVPAPKAATPVKKAPPARKKAAPARKSSTRPRKATKKVAQKRRTAR